MPHSNGVVGSDGTVSGFEGALIERETAWRWLLDRRAGVLDGSLRVDDEGHWQCDDARSLTIEARSMLECLAPLAVRERWTLAQLGQSLDGRIATESGHSHYINGFESLVHLHRLRALADAVVVGVGTAMADDPQLTVRHVEGRHPVRVVLDPRGRARATLGVLQSNEPPTLHVTGPGVDTPESRATHCVLALDDAGQFDPADVVALLHERGYQRILVEGGGITISKFIEAGMIDALHLMVAPLLIGSGRPGLQMTPIDTLESALRPRMRTFRCGDDTLFDVCLNAAAV
ncbi:RibD family protein [Halomonas sp. PAMB 3232]|uniref:RibD family protein n=1 Tax=Halomonas sp. PAMB 3232 TaxID=3075221 RepID=UPI002896F3C5|nr:RibD family protein [Halomonas sp. PAMB 3232]WNL38062.1 RibD family protein [Halomonas sp. PAMB 3232]